MDLTPLSLIFPLWLITSSLLSQSYLPVFANGYAKTSVNTVIFRKNALTSDQTHQYTAFYDQDKNLVVAKRTLGLQDWQFKTLPYKGGAEDAHRSISIQLDGHGYLHLAWDHHNHPLKYTRSQKPGSLDFEPIQSMTGLYEQSVSYPEFYRFPDGNLLFLYRDGSSGNGNLVLNIYDLKTATWRNIQSNLLDGQSKRNAYWQACIDDKGAIQLSWTWRESPDVASNHDMYYARSSDHGKSWIKSDGTYYNLPIQEVIADRIVSIPQNSELINQTSMACDIKGNPFIASYWRSSINAVPQYQLVFKSKNHWKVRSLESRTTNFTLSGAGTKSIPISRPQIITWEGGRQINVALVFRDQARKNGVTIATAHSPSFKPWKLFDLTEEDLGRWEPTLDPDLWKNNRVLNLFLQKVVQIDAEGLGDVKPTSVGILEWRPH